jgi:replicative DNA helicase
VSQRLLTSLREEAGTLGVALLDRNQAQELMAKGTVDLFTYEPNKAIFAAMKRLTAPFELNMIAGELEAAGQFDLVGWDYLSRLGDDTFPEYCPLAKRLERLRELRNLRALRDLAREIHAAVHAPLSTSGEAVAMIRERLEEISA